MNLLLGAVFVASLFGSLHCVGMCGPFALLASSNPSKSNSGERKAALGPTAAYSLGRLCTYVTIGGVFGTLGLALNESISTSTFSQWQQTSAVVAGALMIGVGVIALARLNGAHVRLPKIFAPVQRFLHKGFKLAQGMTPWKRGFTIGMMTSLMPCGWLYTFAITAAGTGSPLKGIALMAVFWLGTVPILVLLAFGFHKIGVAVQKRIPWVMAVLVLLVGVFTIFYRAPISYAEDQFQPVKKEGLVEQVEAIDQETLPCCEGHRP